MEELQVGYQPELLLDALKERSVLKIRQIFENFNIVDIADTINQMEDIQSFLFIYKTVAPEYTAEAFTYLDSSVKERIIEILTSEQISGILANQYSDDIVDFIQEMPANLTTKILAATPKVRRNQINQLLNYHEDSAGSIMTTEFIALKEQDTMETALAKVRKFGRKAETISYLFVIDEKRILRGTLRLKEIFFMDDKEVVSDVMESDFVHVLANDDQEEVAQTFKKYDLNAIPVTTNDGRLVGIITADDIIDVIEEEATEDIHMMANIQPLENEYSKTSVWSLAKKGVVWIIILMISSTFTSFILNGYENAMIVVPALSIFVPMLIDTAGNAGNQSVTLVIRALSLGEISTRDYLKVVSKELGVAALVGLAVAIVNFVWINLLDAVKLISLANSNISAPVLGALVAAAMFVSIVVSKFLGASFPLIIKKLKIDPALLAGPLLTTCIDAISLVIYFLLATQIFQLL